MSPEEAQLDWLALLYWTRKEYGEGSKQFWDVYLCTCGIPASLSRYSRALKVGEAWAAAGRPDVRPVIETVWLVTYKADHECEDVRAVCSTRAVAESWRLKLRNIHREQYGFDPKRERFDAVAWTVLTEEA